MTKKFLGHLALLTVGSSNVHRLVKEEQKFQHTKGTLNIRIVYG